MATAPSITLAQQSFDDCGRAIRLTDDESRRRNAIALAPLDAIEEIGDEAEQHKTLDDLMRVVDDDR
jgi:hypothetical protein